MGRWRAGVVRRAAYLVGGASVLLGGCGEELLEPGELELRPVPGFEGWRDDFREGDRLSVHTSSLSGERTLFGEWTTPSESFLLGRGGMARFHVRTSAMSGDSVWLEPAGLAEHRVPLLFGPRGRFARAATLGAGVEHAATVAQRYLLTTEGAEGQLYDLGLLRQSPAFELPCPGERCVVETVLVVGGWIGIFLGPDGASTLDFSSGRRATLVAPEGGAFSDVSGGRVLSSPTGTQWVVGATREQASARVLQITKEGALSFIHLSASRRHAAASYLPAYGLVVYGGHPTAPGGEVLAPAATTFSALALPPDAIEGATLLATDDGVLRLGGHTEEGPGEPQRLELGCAALCVPTAYPLEDEVRPLQLAATGEGELLARLETQAGERIVRLEITASPLRVTEVGASERLATQLVALPTGQVARVGADNTLELYFLP